MARRSGHCASRWWRSTTRGRRTRRSGCGPTGRRWRCRRMGWRCGCWRSSARCRRSARCAAGRPRCGSGCGARAACPGPPCSTASRCGMCASCRRRARSLRDWGRWAARPLGRALDELAARMAFRRRPRALRGAGRRCRAALDAPPGQAAARGFGARRRPVVSRAPRPSAGGRWSAGPCAPPTR